VREINEAVFASQPAAWVLLARNGARLAGIAAYSFLWPAVGLTRSLYLKELYVADAYQRQGVGKLLMQALFDEADLRGCSRVEWTTDKDNVGAQAFYDDLGLSSLPQQPKILYRVEANGEGFHAPR